MITNAELRTIKRRVARPIYPLDTTLIDAATAADGSANDIYATIQNPATHFIYRYLSELVVAVLQKQTDRPTEELSILDWGSGKGYVQYFLSQKGINTVGYETDNFPHKAMWEKFNLDVKTSADGSLPFKDKSFDAVIGFGVLEHVPYDYEALKELNRVLKDDGLLFCFNLPNKSGYMHKVAWWRGVRYHDRLYGRTEVRTILKRAGFNTVGKPWFRQLFPKGHMAYPAPRLVEKIDLALTKYTPLCYLATSVEFVARKQYTYLSVH